MRSVMARCALVLLAAAVGVCFGTRASWAEGFQEIRCAKKGAPTYLLAHGLNGSPYEWDFYVGKVKDKNPDAGIWRTQVKKLGHIKQRAAELADFIKTAADKCKTPEKSVVAIGHSMGGLDLRTIVGSYPGERKYLKAVYTIATPHLGDPNACPTAGGAHDLCGHPDKPGKDSPMKDFNARHPHSEFKHAGIAFTAFWYECKKGEDGVVPVKSQRWEGASISRESRGKGWHKVKHHSTGETGNCEPQNGCTPELCQEDEIHHIMSKQSKK